LVLTITAVESVEVFEKIKRLERALKEFPQSEHRGYPKFYAAVTLAQTQEYGSPRMRSLDGTALRFLQESFADGSFSPEDEPELADIFISGWGYDFFYRTAPVVIRTVQSKGKPYAWLASMLDAEYHVILAWRERGGGYANTVSEPGWKGFETNLVAARAAFSEGWKMPPERPLAAARMVYVAMGDSGPAVMRLLVDRPRA